MGWLRPRVVTAYDASRSRDETEDSYMAKVVKYIPGEIVAAYVAAAGALDQAGDSIPLATVLWIVAAVLFVLAPFWILVAAKEEGKPPPVFQAVAAPISFAAWVFALGGPFAFLAWYQPVYGTLVIILATLIVPFFEKLLTPAPPAEPPA